MTEVTEREAPPPAPPEQRKPNPFARMAGVFFNPVQTMQSIGERPDIVVPLLLIIVLSFLTNYLAVPHLDMVSETVEQLREQGMSEEQIEETAERMGSLQKVMGPVSAALMPLWIAIMAGILFLAFKLFGGAGGYKQAFAVVTYAWIPLILKGVIGTILIMQRSGVQISELMTIVKSNPAFLVDPKESRAAFAFLSAIDVFNLFSMFLMIIGFAALARMSRGRSAAIIVSLWLVWVLGKTGLASIG